VVLELLRNGVPVNQPSHANCTALHWACENGHLETVRVLIQYRADINACNMNDITPVTAAARHGRLEIVQELLSRRASATHCTSRHSASAPSSSSLSSSSSTAGPLHVASEYGHLHVVHALIEHYKGDLVVDHFGELLVKVEGDRDHHREFEVQEAPPKLQPWARSSGLTSSGNRSLVGPDDAIQMALLSYIDAMDSNHCTPLHRAVINGHLEVVRALLSYGAAANASPHAARSPLLAAVERGHFDITALLLEHSANVATIHHSSRTTPLLVAAGYGRSDILSLLLRHAADVNQTGFSNTTALVTAAERGHVAIAKGLLAHGASINIPNANSNTPLLFAASYGHLELVSLLLEHGAQVNQSGQRNNTALVRLVSLLVIFLRCHRCCRRSRCNSVELTDHLYLHDAQHWASEDGYFEIVDLLLDARANVDARNQLGDTALHLAATKGHPHVIELLLDRGANRYIKNVCTINTSFSSNRGAIRRGWVL